MSAQSSGVSLLYLREMALVAERISAFRGKNLKRLRVIAAVRKNAAGVAASFDAIARSHGRVSEGTSANESRAPGRCAELDGRARRRTRADALALVTTLAVAPWTPGGHMRAESERKQRHTPIRLGTLFPGQPCVFDAPRPRPTEALAASSGSGSRGSSPCPAVRLPETDWTRSRCACSPRWTPAAELQAGRMCGPSSAGRQGSQGTWPTLRILHPALDGPAELDRFLAGL